MTKNQLPVLPLKDMDKRHKGFTPPIASSFLEAARVCLDRHHNSPQEFTLEDDEEKSQARVEWERSDERIRAAWANTDDATRDGAYAMALAATELLRGLFAVRRTSTKSGADYYIAPLGQETEDLEENWLRLEISGTSGSKSQVKSRLKIKIKQAQQGKDKLPALAAIVGFKVQLILISTVDEMP